MDIKEMLKDTIEDVVNKIKSDKTIADKFQKDPIGTVEKLLNVDLPNEQLEPLVDAVKAKLSLALPRVSTWSTWLRKLPLT